MNILTNTIEDYKRWEDKKLESFTNNTDELTVQIANPNKISKPEKSMVISSLCQNNLVFFKIDNSKYRDQSSIKNLALQVGLGNYEFDSKSDLDGLTEISNNNTNTGMTEYIPYTNKELNWHTDGYYNDDQNSINAWLLFCQTQAEDGGLNKFLDHEIAYILFNQKSSRLNDLMLNNTYNIPKNLMTNRPEINNPVFKFNNQKLHMKFSMRKKNIIWNSSSIEASDILKTIIKDSSKYHIVKRLSEGEGVITNNVIHMRTAFTNSKNKNRLLYRLRSKKRVCI
tara:strand:- start:200 stop:1048 length:849 start_codon:yes stop_codon:yes gene_type:complete